MQVFADQLLLDLLRWGTTSLFNNGNIYADN